MHAITVEVIYCREETGLHKKRSLCNKQKRNLSQIHDVLIQEETFERLLCKWGIITLQLRGSVRFKLKQRIPMVMKISISKETKTFDKLNLLSFYNVRHLLLQKFPAYIVWWVQLIGVLPSPHTFLYINFATHWPENFWILLVSNFNQVCFKSSNVIWNNIVLDGSNLSGGYAERLVGTHNLVRSKAVYWPNLLYNTCHCLEFVAMLQS